ncbi:MAG: ABC transporter ATP-binding protein [Nitrospirae bacterium]|nr:ABC transporter ATP-binding protein [Nitrospirota bacterium]
MNESSIQMEHVWKEYPSWRDSPGIMEFMVNIYKRGKGGNRRFVALQDINLNIGKGECVGIIGRNGAGKSSMLSLMIGTVYPTKGRVKINERVTPLMEMGSGFHPDMTGRENLVLNGVLLGLTKEDIYNQMDAIVDFSEIGEYIDIPVRTYSAGMYLRLAFSIAIHTKPKLLIIDEILAVGDEGFQKKSNHAMLGLIRSGVTTVVVSHNLNVIQEICERVLWLDHGRIMDMGDPGKVISEYRKHAA